MDRMFGAAELWLRVCTRLGTDQVLKLRTINRSLRDSIDNCPRLLRRISEAKQDAFVEPVTDHQIHSVCIGEPTYNAHSHHQRCIPVIDLNPRLHSQWRKWHDVLQHEVSIWFSVEHVLAWDDRMLDTFFVQPPLEFSTIKVVKGISDEDIVIAPSVAGNTLRHLQESVVRLLQSDAVLRDFGGSPGGVSGIYVVACVSECTISCSGGFMPPSDQACRGPHRHPYFGSAEA